MRTRRRFPWSSLAVLLALCAYAAPVGWHREWRLAVAGAWRGLFAAAGDPDAQGLANREPADDPDERATALVAGRAALLEELSETQALLGGYEIARRRYPFLRLVAARLSPADARDPAGAVLDRGAEDGVSEGDAVLRGDALLGVVTRAAPRTAWMRYLTAPGSRVTAKVSPADSRAGLSGGVGAGGDAGMAEASAGDSGREICQVAGRGRGRASVYFYALGSPARKGWPVFTSGLEGPLPEGIYLGVLAGDPAETGEHGVLSAPLAPAAVPLRGLDVIVARRLARDGVGDARRE